ncbi:RAMP superfamily CRISPR-associated protein [Chamaesiphon polymorphus]|uniref:Type III-B CRISPR module RAMP protein Cmr4 n=1 Tax=Chamaesiphon polymorphus CCALA 037 TaxID=2107692 RepID=A0A2T1GLP7_9CYAN|nr:RAMP superfamily CRISPR-associated protein [Chamaesiphon polymorphus]PSB58774.1 type III-B CRISPR module RAMP protein Cmr4 [Chamaesiphon polymorphus CCALA 037]
MYQRAYGIIETLAPLHVGASAGEEAGNLNLIFRDQFTQTGIIPGSSIRGRFRADMRSKRLKNPLDREIPKPIDDRYWYGHEAIQGREDGGTTEAIVKFEYASLVWLPVFCPGQPVVWVTCPRLLKRYKQIVGIDAPIPKPYTAPANLRARRVDGTTQKVLFFNLGFLTIDHTADLSAWIPEQIDIDRNLLVVVGNEDIAQIHDMALYRQSRVKLEDDVKKVAGSAFFNVEALPEGCILIFPIALKELGWKELDLNKPLSLYFGGLESVGFGRCQVRLGGN